MKYFLIPAVCLIPVWLFSLRGRRDHPGLEALEHRLYAHRGLHSETVPENSLEAFRLAKERGYGIELDVHLLRDGSLAVLHDSDLLRMTGREGTVEELTAEELGEYFLRGTGETIPAFDRVLELLQGQVPLIVELKSSADNYASLCQGACSLLDTYKGPYCLESFDPRCVLWLKQHRPELIRGQLWEDFLRRLKGKKPWWLRVLGTWQLETFLTRPDFIACRYSDRKTLSNFLIRRMWQVKGVTWTVTTPEDLARAQQEGWTCIFESFLP